MGGYYLYKLVATNQNTSPLQEHGVDLTKQTNLRGRHVFTVHRKGSPRPLIAWYWVMGNASADHGREGWWYVRTAGCGFCGYLFAQRSE